MQKNTQKQGRVTVTQLAEVFPDDGRKVSLATRQKISLSKTKHTKDSLMASAIEYINYIEEGKPEDKRIPSIVGFCLVAGISRSRLYDLAQTIPEVSDIVEYIGMMQEDRAIQGGMTNKLNPIFSMFMLKSKHGYQDTSPKLTQTNNFNISPDLLADALALMEGKSNSK